MCNKAKELANKRFIEKSVYKNKAAWSVLRSEMGMEKRRENFSDIKLNNDLLQDGQSIAEHFNNKFLSKPDSL